MTSAQSNSKGILFILMGMALFSIQDALIKFIYEDAALYELYFGRTFIAFILLVGYLKLSKQKISLQTNYPFLTIIRVFCFFFGCFNLEGTFTTCLQRTDATVWF